MKLVNITAEIPDLLYEAMQQALKAHPHLDQDLIVAAALTLYIEKLNGRRITDA